MVLVWRSACHVLLELALLLGNTHLLSPDRHSYRHSDGAKFHAGCGALGRVGNINSFPIHYCLARVLFLRRRRPPH